MRMPIKLKGLDALVKARIAHKKLGDKSLGPSVDPVEVEETLPLDLEAVTFAVTGVAEILLFNSKDDTSSEDDGIIGAVFPDGGERVWLKYRVGVGAKANGGVESHGFGLSFDATANAKLIQYRAHAPSENAWEAISGDLASPVFAVVPENVRDLAEGDAVVLQAGGKLTAGFKVSWSHIFAQSAGALMALLPGGESIALETGLSASASVEVSIEDSFLLSFARVGERIRLDLKKSRTRSGRAGMKVGVSVRFLDEKAVGTLLVKVVDEIIGTRVDDLITQINNKTYGELGDGTKKVVDEVLSRFDLPIVGDAVAAVREKIGEVQTKAKSILEEVAKAKLEGAFAYEYARVSTSSSVLEAELTPAAVMVHHGQLLRGRVDGLLQAAGRDGSGIELKSFLRKRMLEIKRAYGFGIAVWKLSLAGHDKIDESRTDEERRVAGGPEERRMALTSERGYEGKILGNKWRWSVGLHATMPQFERDGTIGADDFDYGIAVTMERIESNVSRDELTEFLDLAEVWGILPPGRLDSEHNRLERALGGARDVTLTCELKLDHSAFKGVLGELARGDTRRVSRAMARSMYWMSGHGGLRSNPDKREQSYAEIWQSYLTSPHLDAKGIADVVYARLNGHYRELAILERDGMPPRSIAPDGRTVGGLVYASSQGPQDSTRRVWKDLAEGAADLLSAVTQGRKGIGDCFKKMRRHGEQSFWTRAFGTYLSGILESRPLLLVGVDRIATVEFKRDGKEVAIALCSSRAPGA
jgi:hypothetical protein